MRWWHVTRARTTRQRRMARPWRGAYPSSSSRLPSWTRKLPRVPRRPSTTPTVSQHLQDTRLDISFESLLRYIVCRYVQTSGLADARTLLPIAVLKQLFDRRALSRQAHATLVHVL